MTLPNGRPETEFRRLRRAQNLRQRDVARKAGCSVSLVSMVESGYIPRLGLRERLAAAVGASGGLW